MAKQSETMQNSLMRRPYIVAVALTLLLLGGCDLEAPDPGPAGDPMNPDPPNEPNRPTPGPPTNPPANPNTVFEPSPTDIGDVDGFYDQDGYASVNVIRMDVRTVTTPGVCTVDDQSGCTLKDVLEDTNNKDDFKVEIPIHVTADDFPNDGQTTNATLRQRGNTARFGPQKSFRIKLDSKDILWRNERRLQLNKHPFEFTRIKNKLSFDLLRTIPHFPSLRTQFINLWIDDGQGPEDYGLFTHVEFAGGQYLKNRGINPNDNLYKIDFFEFSEGDLNRLQVDAEGQPLDKAEFETRLEIESGTDHRKVGEMLTAMIDPSRSFDSILDQYFNRNNVLTWITVNLLLHQTDAITHNFYLYNPEGSDRFYFLPWDYDGTFELEPTLRDSFANDALSNRKFYGYARGINSQFVDRYYRLPGIHQKIQRAANELRNTYLTDAQIMNHTQVLNDAVEPFLSRAPDNEHQSFEPTNPQRFVSAVARMQMDMRDNFDVPIAPDLQTFEVDGQGILQLRWTPAFDVTERNSLTYDLIVSTSALFEPDATVFSTTNIADNADADDLITYPINTNVLPSGQLFVRIIARPSTNPTLFWQTNDDFHRLPDGSDLFGMKAITLP